MLIEEIKNEYLVQYVNFAIDSPNFLELQEAINLTAEDFSVSTEKVMEALHEVQFFVEHC